MSTALAINHVQEIRASSLATIMQCVGPVTLKDQLPNELNPAAEAGTAAGELLQAMLEQRNIKPQVHTHATNGVRFDEDMFFYLTPIAETLLATGFKILCETRIDFMTYSGILLRGQYDISYYDEANRTLYVEDLKYGYGIVNVKENWQLLAYAIGEMARLHREGKVIPEFYVFRIHQPRAWTQEGTTRTWSINHTELMKYHGKIEARFSEIAQGCGSLQTGAGCKYCKASTVCPAFNQAYHNGLDVILNDWTQDNMSEADIAKQLDLANRAVELAKIRIKSLTQLGVMRIKEGKVIPGKKLEDSYGHRKWKHIVTPESFKHLTGVDITKQTLLSPSDAEKIGGPKVKKFMEMLTERPFNGVNLVDGDAAADAEKVFGKR